MLTWLPPGCIVLEGFRKCFKFYVMVKKSKGHPKYCLVMYGWKVAFSRIFWRQNMCWRAPNLKRASARKKTWNLWKTETSCWLLVRENFWGMSLSTSVFPIPIYQLQLVIGKPYVLLQNILAKVVYCKPCGRSIFHFKWHRRIFEKFDNLFVIFLQHADTQEGHE